MSFFRCGGRHLAAGLAVCLLVACGDQAAPPVAAAPHDDHGHDHGPEPIGVPDTVQRNLGITWATAEYRVVQGILRLPGRLMADPDARRPYPVPTPGRIELLVQPFQTVAVGTVLYRLHAPAWQRLQQELADAVLAVASSGERRDAAQAKVAGLERTLPLWRERLGALEQLDKAIGGKALERAETATRIADLEVALAEARSALAEAERQADGAARQRLDLLLAQASQLTGLDRAGLLTETNGVPAWAGIDALAIRATRAGQVEGTILATGTWAMDHATVLMVSDPAGLHLRAAGLQADLPRLRDGLPARIVASDPAVAAAIPAVLTLGPVADPTDRSLEVIARIADGAQRPAWLRPGVTAVLEIAVDGSAEEELAIPVGATIRDGLKTLLFRRDPARPEQVLPVEADLGTNDGRWVIVNSGLKEGDQVVLGGIYPLKLSQQSGGTGAAHVHPDGTVHTGKH